MTTAEILFAVKWLACFSALGSLWFGLIWWVVHRMQAKEDRLVERLVNTRAPVIVWSYEETTRSELATPVESAEDTVN